MGIVHAAIYDAVVAIEGGYQPYAVTPTVPPNTSVEAAVATAAHRVLVGRFPDQQAGLDDLYFTYLIGIPDGEAKTNGIMVGEEVGVGMLTLRANDGLDSIVPYVQRRPGPGVYEPTAPATPLGTRMPHVLPLALEIASQFRPNGPPALHGGHYARDLNEVKALGRVDSSVRSAEQTAVARFWTDHDIPQWNRNLLRLAAARGLTSIETARMLAMAHVAGGDAMIGCFDAKYHYLSWRPVHAIQRADMDGNPHTMRDPTWQPLLPTPNHPEYPSAHACHTTAIAEALESFFGPGRLRFSVDSLVTGETRYTTDSRTWSWRSTMPGCGQASTSAMRKRMDRSWGGRLPGSWSGTSSSRSTESGPREVRPHFESRQVVADLRKEQEAPSVVGSGARRPRLSAQP